MRRITDLTLKVLIMTSWFSISTFVLSGCNSRYYQSVNAPKTVTGLLNKTDRLMKQQRWGEAQYILEQGMVIHPDEQVLEEKLLTVKLQWTTVKRRLEDWILIYEVESLLSQRPLLVSLSQSKPDDYYLKLRLNRINSKLDARGDFLLRCAEYQLDKAIKLARRCIVSARRVEASAKVKSLLKQLDLQLDTQQQDVQEKNTLEITKIKLKNAKLVADNQAASRASKIMLARSQLQAQLYYEALTLLEPLLLNDHSDQAVAMLMDEAMTGRDLQVLQLISHGDRLYREENIVEAINLWQQASRLNPEDASIIRRIERARKVMTNLQQLRDDKSSS